MTDVGASKTHVPVMLQEVLKGLQPVPGKVFLDGTVGHGGHAAALMAACDGKATLVGMDRDEDALRIAHERLLAFGDRVLLAHNSYQYFDRVLEEAELPGVDGILLDLGVSSRQLDDADRGFSFQHDGPLDMRMDTDQDLSAADIVNQWPQDRLADLIYDYGEERLSRRYARAICEARQQDPITRTQQLATIILKANPRKGYQRIHPATRTFQALRIAVNHELDELDAFLDKFLDYLNPAGRIAILAYHSLEDRRVKQAFRQAKQAGTLDVLTKRPLTAGEAEVADNPRARSAKLRLAAKKEIA